MSDRETVSAATPPNGPDGAEMGVKQRRAWFTSGLNSFRNYGLMLGVAVIWVVFDVRTGGIFLSQRNLGNLGVQTAITGIAAVSAVMLIVTRNFDLSVGSSVALVGVILAELTITAHWALLPAIAVAIIVGVVMGLWQGWVVARLAVPSFIVTLAGMLYFRGISLIIPNGETIAPVGPDLSALATGWLLPLPSFVVIALSLAGVVALRLSNRARAHRLGLARESLFATLSRLVPFLIVALLVGYVAFVQGIPYLILLLGLVAVGANFVMRGTRLGQQFYAMGSNPEAARLAGIDLPRALIVNFAIAGLLYGINGIVLTARVGGAVAGTAGLFLELDAIAAAVIGGTSLSGGRGTIFGALLGALLMTSLDNGMSLMNVPSFYQEVSKGVILLLAVALDMRARGVRRAG
jgi:D-xylose transport system permease protein